MTQDEGTAASSYVSNLLSVDDLTTEDEENIKWTAASLYAGGADTVCSMLLPMFLELQIVIDRIRQLLIFPRNDDSSRDTNKGAARD